MNIRRPLISNSNSGRVSIFILILQVRQLQLRVRPAQRPVQLVRVRPPAGQASAPERLLLCASGTPQEGPSFHGSCPFLSLAAGCSMRP